jgi:hypothetical protein
MLIPVGDCFLQFLAEEDFVEWHQCHLDLIMVELDKLPCEDLKAHLDQEGY